MVKKNNGCTVTAPKLGPGLKHPETTPATVASKRFVHRIKPAGMKRMASKKTTQGEIQTTNRSVVGKSLYGIL